jgi:hypothetical protein
MKWIEKFVAVMVLAASVATVKTQFYVGGKLVFDMPLVIIHYFG